MIRSRYEAGSTCESTTDLPHDKSVILHPTSGNVNIFVFSVAYQFDGITMLIDRASRKKERTTYGISSNDFKIQQQKALIGSQIFTGESCFS